ncbi:MAG: ABC transporter substrate-binding protein [Burkholderiales bacterium]|nr:ABC transporter substrate-binding protein [Burkholderiales bacterium]
MKRNIIKISSLVKFLMLNFCLVKACLAINSDTQRVIAIGPSVNSIIKAIGAESSIVGVDTQSTDIYSKKIADVGYMRSVSLEGLLSLKPNICIATSDVAPRSAITALNKYKVKTVVINKVENPNSIYNNIILVGDALGYKDKALELREKVIQQVNNALSSIPNGKKSNALFLLQLSSNSVFILGNGTHGDWWMKLIKLNNISDISGMKPLSREGFISSKPDLIIIAKANDKLQFPYQADLNKYSKNRNIKVVNVPSNILEGFGAKFGENTKYLVDRVYYD